MFIIITAFVGLIMNRIRGGGLTDFVWQRNLINEKDERFIKPFSKILHDVVFALIFSYGLNVGFDEGGLLCFLTLFVAMWCGRSIGWGTYIDGIIRREVKDEREVAFIDKLIMQKKDHPVLRNVVALSLRGLIWTLCLAVGFFLLNEQNIGITVTNIALVAISGLLMGTTYLIAIGFCQKLKRITNIDLPAWGFAECIWGFVLWGICAQILFGV
jgi:hypothetical protein